MPKIILFAVAWLSFFPVKLPAQVIDITYTVLHGQNGAADTVRVYAQSTSNQPVGIRAANLSLAFNGGHANLLQWSAFFNGPWSPTFERARIDTVPLSYWGNQYQNRWNYANGDAFGRPNSLINIPANTAAPLSIFELLFQSLDQSLIYVEDQVENPVNQIGDDAFRSVSYSVNPLPGTFPVTWASFTATPTEGGSVSLRWETASELNNAFFEIERSSEKDFSVPQKLGETPGMGTSNVGARYVFPDQNFPRGLMYYRLRQVDIDGSFSYSNIISANIPASSFEAELGPSPATDACTLWLHAIPSTGYQLRVYDSMGKEVWYKNEQNPAASAQEIALPVQALPTGTYLLSIKTDEKEISRKLVVVRE